MKEEKLTIKEIIKLNERLGDNYVLLPLIRDEWKVVRGDASNVIISSKTDTIESLLKFVDEHTVYNPIKVICNTSLIINMLLFIVCIVNTIFIQSHLLTGLCFGGIITLFVITIIISWVQKNNIDVKQKVLAEDADRTEKLFEKLKEEIEKFVEKESKKGKTKKENKKEQPKKAGKPKKTNTKEQVK